METAVEIPLDTAAMQPANNGTGAKLPRRSRTRQGKTRLLTFESLDGRTAAAQAALKLIDTLSGDWGATTT